MPIYDMECQDCKKTYEYFLKTAGAEVHCTGCGSEKLVALPSRIGAIISHGTSDSRVVIQDLPCGCRGIQHENQVSRSIGRVDEDGNGLVFVGVKSSDLEEARQIMRRTAKEITDAL